MRADARTLVTGGTRGIGAAVVRRLASDGRHEVIAAGRSAGPSPSWLGTLGPPAATVRLDHADCTDLAAVEALFARADADGRGLTGLVHSAGVWEPSPLAGEPAAVEAAFERILDVNLMGTVRVVSAFARHARRGAPSSVVLVGSTAGQRGESGHGAYAASKAALAGLAKSWAVELAATGIRVNVVAPGWVDTDMARPALGDPARRRAIEAEMPRGRVATPEEIAGPIAFLLSEDSVHVTGTVISVNGGAVLGSQ